jgi:hypothetical protein
MRAGLTAMAFLLPAMGLVLGGCPAPDVTPDAPGMANPGKAVSAPLPSYVEIVPDDAPTPEAPAMNAPPLPHD